MITRPRPRSVFRHALLGLLAGLSSFAACALDPGKSFHHYVQDSWSIEQGLPQISALALAQDAQGYLWVGTQAGLARFDGHRFVTYTPEATPALAGAFINELLHDPQGRLWIATYKGLAVRQEGRFAAVPLADGQGGVRALNVVALTLDGEGGLLAAADNSVYAVQAGSLVERHVMEGAARSLLRHDGALWVGSLGRVYRIAGDQPPQALPLPAEAASAVVTQLLFAQQQLWAATSQGLFRLGAEGWQRYAGDPDLARNPIEALLEDADGNLWVADLSELVRLRDGEVSERIGRGGAALGVRALFEDRERNLWLGSQWNGVTRLRNGWTRRYSQREGLNTPLLWSVAATADDRLWVGTDDGLSRFEQGRFTPVLSGAQLPHPNAYTLLVEGEQLWIGTRRGLALYTPDGLQRPKLFDPLLAHQINGLLRDPRGALWIASTGGLFRQLGDRLDRYAEAAGLADPRVRHLLLTRDGRLLVASHAGLYEFVDERLQPLGRDLGLPADLDITALHELADGRLVAGSISETLYYFDGQRWHRIGQAQGFPANAAFFLGSDDEFLWIAGIRGVQRLPLADLEAFAQGRIARVRGQMLLNERGDRRGGQKGYCCNGAGNAKGLLRDGQLWAPTRDGLVALSAADVRFAERPPTTLIERLRIGAQWQDNDEALDLQLPASARDLAFEFTAISFEDPRSIGFRYRLLGYHEDWREPDEAGQRVVGYTNLPAGDYAFEVQGSSTAERWSEPARIEFRIQPYFRETPAFYALLAALLGLLGYAGYRLQRLRYRRQAEALERLVQQRTEALAEANQRLQEASHTDPLTGLRNRRYLALQIPKDLAFYGRELRRAGSIGQVIVFAIVDIDHFKHINDEHGHAAGDRVLQQFAALLQKQVRTGDYVARWGGEEFIVVFRPTPADYLPLLGERIRRAAAAHAFDIGEARPLQLTCSIGLVEYPLFYDANDSLSWEQLIELADRALYYVKRHGRDGWAAYRPAPGIEVNQVLELLRLDENEFERRSELEIVHGRAPAA